eukprot:186095_1
MGIACSTDAITKTSRKKNDPLTVTDYDFIIKHLQNNKQIDGSIDIENFDQRRLVFVSLIGAYQTWKQCPSVSLYTALFLVPLKRDWLYNPTRYGEELNSNFIHPLRSVSDTKGRQEFMQLLRWKDNQKLVFWMEDEYPESPQSLTHPFWHHLSNSLCNLYDPITQTKYKPLHLEHTFWLNNDTKYEIETLSVLYELCFLTKKFKAIQVILLQSHSDSLHPVKYYGSDGISTTNTPLSLDGDDEDGNWWVSPQYNVCYIISFLSPYYLNIFSSLIALVCYILSELTLF